jgi:hypothetical protein
VKVNTTFYLVPGDLVNPYFGYIEAGVLGKKNYLRDYIWKITGLEY